MAFVTLIGERLGREGREFVFFGPANECKECKLKSVCLNLDEGRRYRVRSVRDNRHDCRVHEGGVRAVEIEKVPVAIAMRTRDVIEGALISFVEIDCGNPGCASYRLCHPYGLRNGTKWKVAESGERVKCPEGYELREVRVV